MRIDAARRDDAAGGVDLARAGRQALAELHDAAAGDADVGIEGVARGGDAGVAHHQVESAHLQVLAGTIVRHVVGFIVDNSDRHFAALPAYDSMAASPQSRMPVP